VLQLIADNDELELKLHDALDDQRRLGSEVIELQERYSEVAAILYATQCELRAAHRLPVRSGSADSLYESLASEIEAATASDSGIYSSPSPAISAPTSSRRHRTGADMSLDLSYNHTGRFSKHYDAQPQLETVAEILSLDLARTPMSTGGVGDELASTTEVQANVMEQTCPIADAKIECTIPTRCEASTSMSTPISHRSRTVSARNSPPSSNSIYRAATIGSSLSRQPSTDSLAGYQAPELGCPGVPGTRDLEYAIRRLAVRRMLELDFERFAARRDPSRQSTPRLGHNTSMPRAQIFKPLEGSRTLQQWKRMSSGSSLATAAESNTENVCSTMGIYSRSQLPNMIKNSLSTDALNRRARISMTSPLVHGLAGAVHCGHVNGIVTRDALGDDMSAQID
jgi:hypothetical protein